MFVHSLYLELIPFSYLCIPTSPGKILLLSQGPTTSECPHPSCSSLLFSLLLILGRLGTLSSLKSPPQKPSWLHHHAIPLELTPLFLVVSCCPLSCLHFTIPPSTSDLCPDSPFVFPHSLLVYAGSATGLNNSLTSHSFSLQFTPHIAAGWSS